MRAYSVIILCACTKQKSMGHTNIHNLNTKLQWSRRAPFLFFKNIQMRWEVIKI